MSDCQSLSDDEVAVSRSASASKRKRHISSDEELQTPTTKHWNDEQAQRSSERLKKKQNKVFQMPSRDQVWNGITENSPANIDELRPRKRVSNLTKVCTCGHCVVMSTEIESLCCREVGQIMAKIEDDSASPCICITEHPGFSQGCLNRYALDIAYLQYRQQYGGLPRDEDANGASYNSYNYDRFDTSGSESCEDFINDFEESSDSSTSASHSGVSSKKPVQVRKTKVKNRQRRVTVNSDSSESGVERLPSSDEDSDSGTACATHSSPCKLRSASRLHSSVKPIASDSSESSRLHSSAKPIDSSESSHSDSAIQSKNTKSQLLSSSNSDCSSGEHVSGNKVKVRSSTKVKVRSRTRHGKPEVADKQSGLQDDTEKEEEKNDTEEASSTFPRHQSSVLVDDPETDSDNDDCVEDVTFSNHKKPQVIDSDSDDPNTQITECNDDPTTCTQIVGCSEGSVDEKKNSGSNSESANSEESSGSSESSESSGDGQFSNIQSSRARKLMKKKHHERSQLLEKLKEQRRRKSSGGTG